MNRGEAWLGPHIFDWNGELIWSGAPLLDHYRLHDFRVQKYRGEDVLTAIYHHRNAGVIIDKKDRIIREIVYTHDYMELNMHEFGLFHDGSTALMATRYIPVTLTREQSANVGFEGNCSIKGNGFHYLDISGTEPRMIMDWNATDHIFLNESAIRFDTVEEMCGYRGDDKELMWDPFHVNAVELMPSGDFLVSARLANTIYKISHVDGHVIWRLGGQMSNWIFTSREAEFYWQHHARFLSENATHTVILVFDNEMQGVWDEGTLNDPLPTSRGIVLSLDHEAWTVSLVTQFIHPLHHHLEPGHPLNNYTAARGSVQVLENENVLVGWSNYLLHSEYASNGELLRWGHILPDIGTYRCQKHAWTVKPSEPPSIYSAAFISGDNTTTMAFVSWNGDTETRRWNFYSVDEDGENAELIAGTPRDGFETAIELPRFVPHLVAEARDVDGGVLVTSRPVSTLPPLEWEAERSSELASVFGSSYVAFGLGILATITIWRLVLLWRERGTTKLRWWRSRGGDYERVSEMNGADDSESAVAFGKQSELKLQSTEFG